MHLLLANYSRTLYRHDSLTRRVLSWTKVVACAKCGRVRLLPTLVTSWRSKAFTCQARIRSRAIGFTGGSTNRAGSVSRRLAETGPSRTVRSMTLTSHELQLTATMDLVEIDGLTAVPVEYRKGGAPIAAETIAMLRTRRASNRGRPIASRRPCKPSCSSRPATMSGNRHLRCGGRTPRRGPFDNAMHAEAWRRWMRPTSSRGPRPLPLLNVSAVPLSPSADLLARRSAPATR